MSGEEDPRINEARRIMLDPNTEPWRVKVLQGLLDMVELLDGPYTPSCDCGWVGSEWETKADAWAEMWSQHPRHVKEQV